MCKVEAILAHGILHCGVDRDMALVCIRSNPTACERHRIFLLLVQCLCISELCAETREREERADARKMTAEHCVAHWRPSESSNMSLVMVPAPPSSAS